MTHPVDIHVGKKIREARVLRGLTQTKIAERLGISFQQLQKYETGNNRVSASRLFEIAELLGVKPAYFFEGLGAGATEEKMPLDAETAKVASALSRIADERIKAQIHTFIYEISRQTGEKDDAA